MIGSWISTRLRADVDIAAEVGSKVRPNMARQEDEPPYIVYTVVTDEYMHDFSAVIDLANATFTLDIYTEGDTGYSEAMALVDLIKAEFTPAGGTAAGFVVTSLQLQDISHDVEPPLHDGDKPTYRVTMTYSAWYRAA